MRERLVVFVGVVGLAKTGRYIALAVTTMQLAT